jgi:hypothetical protein
MARAQIALCRAARLKRSKVDLHGDLIGLSLQNDDPRVVRSPIAQALSCYVRFYLYDFAPLTAALWLSPVGRVG